jgi:hypothetical protein
VAYQRRKKGYKGTVNKISMVEADKTGPYATTPLGICMKSSTRQPLSAGVSLHDCRLKDPLAHAGNARNARVQGSFHQRLLKILPMC